MRGRPREFGVTIFNKGEDEKKKKKVWHGPLWKLSAR